MMVDSGHVQIDGRLRDHVDQSHSHSDVIVLVVMTSFTGRFDVEFAVVVCDRDLPVVHKHKSEWAHPGHVLAHVVGLLEFHGLGFPLVHAWWL